MSDNQVCLVNDTEVEYASVIETVLPWKKGVMTPNKLALLKPSGAQTVLSDVIPLGAGWSDGSYRHTLVRWRDGVPANKSMKVDFEFASNPAERRPFTMDPQLLAMLTGNQFAVMRGTMPWTALQSAGVIEQSNGVVALRYIARDQDVSCTLNYELWLEVGTNDPFTRFTFIANASDTSRDNYGITLQESLSLCVSKGFMRIRHSDLKVMGGAHNNDGSSWATLALPGQRIGDGQSIVVEGLIAPFNYVPAEPILAVATTWPESGAFGIFGHVPARPPWITSEEMGNEKIEQLARREYASGPRGFPFGWNYSPSWHGNLENTGNTGDQPCFGACKLYETARTGNPLRLRGVHRSILQMGGYAIWQRDHDMTLLNTQRHPHAYLWNGRAKYPNNSPHPDSLGKSREIDFYGGELARSSTGNTWSYIDRQHFEPTYLTAFALLTGNRFARWACDYMSTFQILANPINSGNASMDGIEAERAVGRGLQSMANLWLVTGREDLKQRMDERIYAPVTWSYSQWTAFEVRPLEVFDAEPWGTSLLSETDNQAKLRLALDEDIEDLANYFDAASPQATVKVWLPWQAGMAVKGLESGRIATGNPNANAIARSLARNVCMYGMVKRSAIPPGGGAPVDTWQIGKHCLWNNGVPLTMEQRNNPAYFTPADGTGYIWWAAAAWLLGEKWAEEAGDTEWLERCQEIRRATLKQRTPPNQYTDPLGWDESVTEHCAVVADPFALA